MKKEIPTAEKSHEVIDKVVEVIKERIYKHDKMRKLSKNHSNHDAESSYYEAIEIYNLIKQHFKE